MLSSELEVLLTVCASFLQRRLRGDWNGGRGIRVGRSAIFCEPIGLVEEVFRSFSPWLDALVAGSCS